MTNRHGVAPTFGLFLNTGGHLASTHAEIFDLAEAQTRVAERCGLHDVWVSEHHFMAFGINSSAMTLAAFLLGRSTRVRLGTAVTLVPHYHPLQLAEQAAILDQVSGGRFDFGIGRGGYLSDFEGFGTDVDRWNDAVETTTDVLLEAWGNVTGERKATQHSEPPLPVVPRPRTQPHPPLFLATRTPASVAFAARRGLPLLHYWAAPVESRLAAEGLYAEHSACSPHHVHTLIAIPCDNERRTRDRLLEATTLSFRLGDHPLVPGAEGRRLSATGHPPSSDDQARMVVDNAIVGPPAVVIEGLRTFLDVTGARRVVLYMEALGERSSVLESIQRFADEVMPAFGPYVRTTT
jgi:alkanesulfonate monooxygenase SsuD/methylene tetrahydromethanopterin reductase-like flavin-dependent oxidoreductase (luciferase family)